MLLNGLRGDVGDGVEAVDQVGGLLGGEAEVHGGDHLLNLLDDTRNLIVIDLMLGDGRDRILRARQGICGRRVAWAAPRRKPFDRHAGGIGKGHEGGDAHLSAGQIIGKGTILKPRAGGQRRVAAGLFHQPPKPFRHRSRGRGFRRKTEILGRFRGKIVAHMEGRKPRIYKEITPNLRE